MLKNKTNLLKILARQKPGLFGADYVSSIMAMRGEAPRSSRGSILISEKLGRGVHVLSTPERCFALLALYHPAVFDLHEQKMISTGAIHHPLYGHPKNAGRVLPRLEGSVEVFRRLGFLEKQPRISICTEEHPQKLPVPYPYIGDFLLFIENESNAPYCINWTVKKRHEDFEERRRDSLKSSVKQLRDQDAEVLRHEVENRYYRDGGIRTVQLAASDLDVHVNANLSLLFRWNRQAINLAQNLIDDLVGDLNDGVAAGVVPKTVIDTYLKHNNYNRSELLSVFYKSVWTRALNVDLFSPVLVDKPMRSNVRDVLHTYRHFFEEN